MKANPNVNSMDEMLDSLYGAAGTTERENFRKEAYAYCAGLALNKQKSPTPKAFGDFCVPQSGIEPESNL